MIVYTVKDIHTIQAAIEHCNASSETNFSRLAEAFPQLLSVVADTSSNTSLPDLQNLLAALLAGFTDTSTGNDGDEDFFTRYNAETSSLFDTLNERMNALEHIHGRVEGIRKDSEELELISLNAMVISIKSGEKGRAFSCITENLKRLSAQLISLSNNLILEEKRLLEKNADFRSRFQSVSRQESLDGFRENALAGKAIVPALTEGTIALRTMAERATEVKKPIRDAMSGIQLQDIIRQSNDQIILALKEVSPVTSFSSAEEALDHASVNRELLEICKTISEDVARNLESSISIFTSNWATVNRILDEVDSLRRDFSTRYLEHTESATSLPNLLARITASFSLYLKNIAAYQHTQRSMVSDSASIVAHIKSLKSLFETIKPIIARLQHVRITQQIEVAKNTALASVKDTVLYMSNLIMQADQNVQETRAELEGFISGIEELTAIFTEAAHLYSRDLERIKQERTQFFRTMEDNERALSLSVHRLQVYPDSFRDMCREVDGQIEALARDVTVMKEASRSFAIAAEENAREQERLLSVLNLESWNIKNDRLRALVTQFTITAHKEAAGTIGGFTVEGLGSEQAEAGDVTLFF